MRRSALFAFAALAMAACSPEQSAPAPSASTESPPLAQAEQLASPPADLTPDPAARPSFNCAKASNEVEKAICARAALADLDKQVADAFADARKRLGAAPEAITVLREDQKYWLGGRDMSMIPGAGMGLDAYMDSRLQELASIGPPRKGLGGKWINLTGFVDVKESGVRASVHLSTAEPSRAVWVCEVEGQAVREGDALKIDGPEGWTIRVQRDGPILRVMEAPPPSDPTAIRPYCGHNGLLAGAYLPAKS
jgi:uncharacterized protein